MRRGSSAEPSQASHVSSGVLFDLYVKTNRATTDTAEYNQLREQAERILNDEQVKRSITWDDPTEPPKLDADRVDEFVNDPDFRSLSKADQKQMYEELTGRKVSGHFVLYRIPDYMKTVIPSKTTSLGGLVNIIGFIGVTIFCLALYFPLTTSIIDLFRRRRTIKK